MSQGTLYVGEYARCFLVQGLIKFYNLDVACVSKDATFEKLFPLGKFPAFVGPKGFKLTEVNAVALYRELPISLPPPTDNNEPRKRITMMINHFLKLYSYPCLNKSCRGYFTLKESFFFILFVVWVVGL